jgi:hypothetical protein
MSLFGDSVGKQNVLESFSTRKNDLVMEFEVCLCQYLAIPICEKWLEICKDDE